MVLIGWTRRCLRWASQELNLFSYYLEGLVRWGYKAVSTSCLLMKLWPFSESIVDNESLGRAMTILIAIPIGILWIYTSKCILGVHNEEGKKWQTTRKEKGIRVDNRLIWKKSTGRWSKGEDKRESILFKCCTLDIKPVQFKMTSFGLL